MVIKKYILMRKVLNTGIIRDDLLKKIILEFFLIIDWRKRKYIWKII